jgi:predicted LPLAT superfamily acyltransferase
VVPVAAAPFALALVSGAPLLIVFAVKLGKRHYRFTCDAPITLKALTRADRERAMQDAATTYLGRLREMAQAHPEQWQTFGELLRTAE